MKLKDFIRMENGEAPRTGKLSDLFNEDVDAMELDPIVEPEDELLSRSRHRYHRQHQDEADFQPCSQRMEKMLRQPPEDSLTFSRRMRQRKMMRKTSRHRLRLMMTHL